MSKIQFLKAIHNFVASLTIWQRCCLRCQRYNFWKQFTTRMDELILDEELFTMSKIQFLKAIHNWWSTLPLLFLLFTMSKIQFLKAIHNKLARLISHNSVVYDVKDTIFESNSQHVIPDLRNNYSCLRCQRYNFWKQFTTIKSDYFHPIKLFTMSKIQFLKAIHNAFKLTMIVRIVVYDVKDTIFESNSQHKFTASLAC